MISLSDQQRKDRSDVFEYIEGVLSGNIVVSKWVKLAVERHESDLKRAKTRGFVFSEAKALYSLEIFPIFQQSKGKWAAKPLILAPWQKFIVWSVFGWIEAATGNRRFTRVYATVARKNGKSTFCSALALYLLRFDNEAGAEIYTAATKRDQAKIIFNESRQMVLQSPSLQKFMQVHKTAITAEREAAKFVPLGSDSTTQDGLNPHGVIKDELHAWREHHRELYEKLRTGGGAREQPLEVTVTTAGSDDSLLWIEDDDYATLVLESEDEVIDDRLFAFIARLDPDDDPFDQSVWVKANPNLGVSVKEGYLEAQATEAKNKPTAFNSFKRYHCNIRVQSSEAPITRTAWRKQLLENPPETSKSTHGGFDLGRSDDFAAVARCTPFELDGETNYYLRCRSYAAADRPKSQFATLTERWIEEGQLIEHWGNQLDFRAIYDDLIHIHNEESVAEWWYDQTYAKVIAQDMMEQHAIRVEKFGQTAQNYNEPIRVFLREFAAGRIWHDGNPCTAWQMCNLTITPNAKDEWMPDKSNHEKKIDAAVATLMAFANALFAETQPRPQLY